MELTNKEILSVKVITLDDDGFAVGKISESNHPSKKIQIPFNKNNISFSVNDHLLVELESKNKKLTNSLTLHKIALNYL